MVEFLSHLMLYCPATSAQRDSVFDEIRFVFKAGSRPVAGGAETLPMHCH
jgi:hypothetical protein